MSLSLMCSYVVTHGINIYICIVNHTYTCDNMSMTFLMFTHTKKDNYTMLSKLFLFTELKSAMPSQEERRRRKRIVH